MLYGKRVVLGVTGGIACYKALDVVSGLKKQGADVRVVMTKNAAEFVAPLSFETLSGNEVALDMFAPKKEYDVRHISLAQSADVMVVAPASANAIAKFANGIADDMLSTVFLACKSEKLICPAMNTGMYEDSATIQNIRVLKERGVKFVEPDCGRLACGDIGKGKLASPSDIIDAITDILTPNRDFDGKTVLITAGATEEDIDGVRVITNHSSGKMGIALAEAAAERGAKVILVHGSLKVDVPDCVYKKTAVKSTVDMLDAVMSQTEETDVFIMAAAPADYRPKRRFDNKIKTKELTIEFEKNPDIAANVGAVKGDKTLVIFSAETEELIANATGKLAKKNADLAVANDVTKEGAGFFTDTNIATLLDKFGGREDLPLMSKRELADRILDRIVALNGTRSNC